MATLPYQHFPTQPSPASQCGTGHEAGAEACRYCGVIDRPTLSPGTGPHAIRATCPHCGTFLRWISLLAPAERMARRRRERLKVMQKHPPSVAQLSYLQALGDKEAAPATMAVASERIEALKVATEAKRSNALGGMP